MTQVARRSWWIRERTGLVESAHKRCCVTALGEFPQCCDDR